jgi:hypothetical protein
MSGRRGNCRYGVMNADATVRILREVTVQNGVEGEFVAISVEPAASGDVFTLERIASQSKISSRVRVIESRPAVVNGSVRYRLRLKLIAEASAGDDLKGAVTARLRVR